MHYPIRILSEGRNRADAHGGALDFADTLVEHNDFDYHAEAGSTHRLTSALGQKAVEGALQATREEFMRALQIVKLMLRDFTDEQIYQEDFGDEERDYYASRWQFAKVGTTKSYLYATAGIWSEAITNDHDYERALQEHDPADLWITTLDFHN